MIAFHDDLHFPGGVPVMMPLSLLREHSPISGLIASDI
jgi:hypothetical protein